ncbi:MAG: alpha/beta hydrolase [Coriobacteriia bacterium]|nr:alpha/beta hydrolase [Coriobacteriia bacterium]MBN2840462.1 alpha/beta hydrolase [Coriobacteriia bacterium]
MPASPPVTIHQAALASTSLRYAACGDGPPLIIVPATISLIEDWTPMIQFVGQHYRAYFFEMPGHGGSTPLEEGFSSVRLSGVIGELADHLGIEDFALLGFSFGGILTLRALQGLGGRVSKVGLLSPCVSNRALTRPPLDRALVSAMISALGYSVPRNAVARLLGSESVVKAIAWFMQEVGGFESPTDIRERLTGFSSSTLDVLVSQVREILTVTEEDLAGPYVQPCFFGMSAFDPLLDYGLTERFVRANFQDLVVETFDWKYHAPPEPLTFEDYVRDYTPLLEADRARVSGNGVGGIYTLSRPQLQHR